MPQPQTKKKRQEKSWIKWLILLLLALGLFLGGTYVYFLQPDLIPGFASNFQEPVTGLLIAVDEDYYAASNNENENGYEKVRADLILWGRISPKEQDLKLMFIPRHTLVTIPSWGEDQIRFAYMAGKIPMTMDIVNELLHEEIDYYAVIDFDSFMEIVDVLEGIEMMIERPIFSEELEIDLEEGLQMINSKEALGYARYIEEDEIELDRIRRQQSIALAIYNRALETRSLARLPQLVMTIIETVRSLKTNVNRDAVVKTVNFLRDMGEPYPSPIILPGEQDDEFWLIDEEEILRIINGVD